jgi:hypothetical protein
MSQLQLLRTSPPYDESWTVATLVNRILGGRLNSVGTVTLTQNGTSTLLSDNNYRLGSRVLLTPTTADAASVSGLYIPHSATAGQATIYHAAVNQPDLAFDYFIVG